MIMHHFLIKKSEKLNSVGFIIFDNNKVKSIFKLNSDYSFQNF